MTAALPLLLTLLAQAATVQAPAAAGPSAPAAKPDASETATADCPPLSTDSREILICAQRPQGYRINPDILEARRELKNSGTPPPQPGTRASPFENSPGRPQPPNGLGAVNLMAVGLTAAEMARRLAEGKDIGSMFMTDPGHLTEYQLYQMAKARREAREQAEADAKAAAKAKAAAAAAHPASEQPSDNR